MSNWKQIKQSFLDYWPLQKVKNMTLDEYTNLDRANSFCYWMESKTTDVLGIGGGSSYKFGIFKRNPNAENKKLKSGQNTDGIYGWYSKYGQTKEEAFEIIKNLIIQTIKYAQNKTFNLIDDIDLGNAFKWKIAYMYAPEETLLRIASDKAFRFLAESYNLNTKQISEIQKKLITLKKPHESFDDFSSELWNKFQNTQVVDKDEEIEDNDMTSDNITKNAQTQPLNQILYGPPGTGKTYHTIDKALEIIDGSVPENRDNAKTKFEQYKQNGQIEFVTFHQSYGYEEFVEGIKAKTTDSGIEYKIESGIFKKLSKKATTNFEQTQKNTIAKKDFDVIFKDLVLDKVSEDIRLEIKMKKSSFFIKEIDEAHIYFDKSGGDSQHVLLIKNLRAMYEVGENKLIMGGLSQYYNPLLEYLLKDSEIKEEEKEPLKNYILIIDEINRGNISKIFGELITLIEESKRIGKDEALHVKLPYSNESFGVPSNLYIIGTMNTADRSIALMDTALRRRFDFTEMMPRPELLENVKVKSENQAEIGIKLILETINKRIEYLYDRDHTIGHAYFMSLKERVKDKDGNLREKTDVEKKDELDNIFKNKIIPLLQEYFYDDWEKIQIVLGDHYEQINKTNNSTGKDSENFEDDTNKIRFIQSRKVNEKDIIGFNHENIEDEGKDYRINPNKDGFPAEAYLKLCPSK